MFGAAASFLYPWGGPALEKGLPDKGAAVEKDGKNLETDVTVRSSK